MYYYGGQIDEVDTQDVEIERRIHEEELREQNEANQDDLITKVASEHVSAGAADST